MILYYILKPYIISNHMFNDILNHTSCHKLYHILFHTQYRILYYHIILNQIKLNFVSQGYVVSVCFCLEKALCHSGSTNKPLVGCRVCILIKEKFLPKIPVQFGILTNLKIRGTIPYAKHQIHLIVLEWMVYGMIPLIFLGQSGCPTRLGIKEDAFFHKNAHPVPNKRFIP